MFPESAVYLSFGLTRENLGFTVAERLTAVGQPTRSVVTDWEETYQRRKDRFKVKVRAEESGWMIDPCNLLTTAGRFLSGVGGVSRVTTKAKEGIDGRQLVGVGTTQPGEEAIRRARPGLRWNGRELTDAGEEILFVADCLSTWRI